jgi:hypothetical protein
MAGHGISKPSEYWVSGHVERAVRDDIAEFVLDTVESP